MLLLTHPFRGRWWISGFWLLLVWIWRFILFLSSSMMSLKVLGDLLGVVSVSQALLPLSNAAFVFLPRSRGLVLFSISSISGTPSSVLPLFRSQAWVSGSSKDTDRACCGSGLRLSLNSKIISPDTGSGEMGGVPDGLLSPMLAFLLRLFLPELEGVLVCRENSGTGDLRQKES